MNLAVKRVRPVGIGNISQRDPGSEGCADKAPCPGWLALSDTNWIIRIGYDGNLFPAREMKIPEHMTGRQRCDQHVFRIGEGWITAKQRVVGARNCRFAGRLDIPGSIITGIGPGPLAAIPGPDNARRVVMGFRLRHMPDPLLDLTCCDALEICAISGLLEPLGMSRKLLIVNETIAPGNFL